VDVDEVGESGGVEHCGHWLDGDGDCCCCGERNWCPDDGETPEALEVFRRRRWGCRAGWSVGGG
jgi:hypothetical protein